MIIVSDKKIVKHTVSTGDALVDISVRVTFEYTLRDQQFVDGSMSRKVLYNIEPMLRRFATVSREDLVRDIETTVDRALVEHLRYAGQVTGDVALYPVEEDDDPPATDDDPPQIILPR